MNLRLQNLRISDKGGPIKRTKVRGPAKRIDVLNGRPRNGYEEVDSTSVLLRHRCLLQGYAQSNIRFIPSPRRCLADAFWSVLRFGHCCTWPPAYEKDRRLGGRSWCA